MSARSLATVSVFGAGRSGSVPYHVVRPRFASVRDCGVLRRSASTRDRALRRSALVRIRLVQESSR